MALLTSRPAVTALDQCLASASNFAVTVAVARLAGASGLGVFSLAYGIWLFLASLHRSLVAEPMAIEGDGRASDRRERLRVGLSAELILGGAGAGICAAAGGLLLALGVSDFGEALLSVAPWTIVLVVQDYWRWAGFMAGVPQKSLLNDAVFAVVQAVAFLGLVVLGVPRSPAFVVAAWGLGALVSAGYGIWQYRCVPSRRGGLRLLIERWTLSRWLVGHDLSHWGSNQGYLLVAGIGLGPVGLGGLKAAQTLVTGPSLVILQAGGSVGLPEASRALAERGLVGLRRVGRAVTGGTTGAVGLIALVVVVAGRHLLTAVYGPSFASLYPSTVVLAVASTIATLGMGVIVTLKAARQTQYLFRAQMISLVVRIGAVLLVAGHFGVFGVAAVAAVANLIFVAGLYTFRRRYFASLETSADRSLTKPESVVSAA
jgi:O-antigen/teichoic acid export membrane protein